jgi:Ca2+/H+ antiporter
MYVCMYVCMFVYGAGCLLAWTTLKIHNIYIYIYTYIHTYIHIHIYIYIYICMYTSYIYIYTHTHKYIYIYKYIAKKRVPAASMPLKSRPKRQTSTPRAEENKRKKNATLKSLPPNPGQNARRGRQGSKKKKRGGKAVRPPKTKKKSSAEIRPELALSRRSITTPRYMN